MKDADPSHYPGATIVYTVNDDARTVTDMDVGQGVGSESHLHDRCQPRSKTEMAKA